MASDPTKAFDAGEADRRFLQRRVSKFALLMGVLAAALWIYRATVGFHWFETDNPRGPTMMIHLGLVGLFAVVAVISRRGTPSSSVLHATESVVFLVTGCVVIASEPLIPSAEAPDMAAVVSLAIVFFTRCIYIPGTMLRSVTLGLLLAPLFFVFTLLAYSGSQNPPAVGQASFALAMWLLITVTGAAATKTIHGLRRELRALHRLGPYIVDSRLGEGGAGVVYRARHAMLRRPAAVKVLHSHRSREMDLLRFEKEVRLTAELSHPNTITVFDYGRTPEGLFYYAMEFLDGLNLEKVVERDGPQPAARVIRILMQVCGSLAEAHSIGLIHRDIKPRNIMLLEQGGAPDVVKVLDFGLVKRVTDPKKTSLSKDGSLVGTAQYLAPESIRTPGQTDPRSDLYALGAVGYFLLTGRPVFTGGTPAEIASKQISDEPLPTSKIPRHPLVPRELEEIVLDCLQKSPDDRPASAVELRRRLAECLDRIGTGSWTRDDAARWWKSYRTAQRKLAETSGPPASSSPREVATIGVDVSERFGSEHPYGLD